MTRSWQWWEYLLVLFVLYLVFCPPRYDPAVRLKEWLDRPQKRK